MPTPFEIEEEKRRQAFIAENAANAANLQSPGDPDAITQADEPRLDIDVEDTSIDAVTSSGQKARSSVLPQAVPERPGSRESLFGFEATEADFPPREDELDTISGADERIPDKVDPLISEGMKSASAVKEQASAKELEVLQAELSANEDRIKGIAGQISSGQSQIRALPDGSFGIEPVEGGEMAQASGMVPGEIIRNPTPAQIQEALRGDLDEIKSLKSKIVGIQGPAADVIDQRPPALPPLGQQAGDPGAVSRQSANIQANTAALASRSADVDELRQAAERERDAVSELGIIEADKSARQAKLLEDEQERLQERTLHQEMVQAQHENELAGAQDVIDKRTKELEGFELDSNRLWNKATTGQKVMRSIALVLGALGAGLAKTPNFALQIIQKQIDNDILAQKVDYAKKVKLQQEAKSVYASLMNEFQDAKKADAAIEATYAKVLQGKVQQLAANMGSDSAIAGAQKINAQLMQKEASAVAKLNQIAQGNAMDAAKLRLKARTDSAKLNAAQLKAGQDRLAPPSAQGVMRQVFLKVPKEQRKEAIAEMKRFEGLQSAKSSIAKMYDEFAGEQFMALVPYTAAGGRAAVMKQAMMGALTDIVGKGGISDRDAKNLEKALPSSFDTNDAVEAKKQSFIKYLDSRLVTPVLKGFGIIGPEGRVSLPAPSGRPALTRLGEPTTRNFSEQEGHTGALPQFTNLAGNMSTKFATDILDRVGTSSTATIDDVDKAGALKIGQRLVMASKAPSADKRVLVKSAKAAEQKHSIPAGILLSLGQTESQFNKDAVSESGATGVYQFTVGTAKEMGLRMTGGHRQDDYIDKNGRSHQVWTFDYDERKDIAKATDAAARLLRKNMKRLKTDNLGLGIMSHNAGAGNVAKALRRQAASGAQ